MALAPAKPKSTPSFVQKAAEPAPKAEPIQKAEPVQKAEPAPTQPPAQTQKATTIKVANVYSYPMFYVHNGEEIRIQGVKTVEKTKWVEDQIKAGLLKEVN